MNGRITWRLVIKELRLGPRSPVFLYSFALPVLMTFLIVGVFGSLFDPSPRLGIVGTDGVGVTAQLLALDDIESSQVDDVSTLVAMVEAHDLDAGLVIPPGFPASGGSPDFYVSGSSLASTRLLLTAVITDLVDDAIGFEPAVEVMVVSIGDEGGVPIGDRLVPLIVFYALVLAGLFMPAASLVEERESGTIEALLVSPARMGDVLAAKGLVAAVVATTMAMATLALNSAFGGQPLLLALILAVGAVMLVEFGLVLGLWARDANTLFTSIKGAGIVIFLPLIFIIWPGLPQWIPQLVPTYYFLNPVYEVGVLGVGPGEVFIEIAVAAAICLLLVPLVVAYARRAERRLAISV